MSARIAELIPLDQKKEKQVLEDMALSPQERVDWFFRMNMELMSLQNPNLLPTPEKHEGITLKRVSNGKLPG